MGFDSKQKKRKAAKPALSPIAKKTKVDADRKKKSATTAPIDVTASAVKPSPKRMKAVDFLSSDDDDEEAWAGIVDDKGKGKAAKANKKENVKKKGKKEKRVEAKETKTAEPEKKVSATSTDAGDDGVSPDGEEEETILLDASGGPDSDDSEAEEADDHTMTLLKGFESSDDEEWDERGAGNSKLKEIDGARFKGAKIPGDNKTKKKLGALVGRVKSIPGIIYLGRIPHGFYEHEMRSYFSQFGEITRLRLSRNKRTGKSKHYAFIEFADADVATIVADTMNNYLLFGHILKCKIVPRDDIEVAEKLFIGANKRFKPRPGAKLQKAELKKKRTREEWEKKEKTENAKRKGINKRLKSKGIDYEFDAPMVKTPVPKDALIEDATKAVEAPPTEEVEAIEAAVEVEKTVTPTANEAAKKADMEETVEKVEEVEVEEKVAKKAKKAKTKKPTKKKKSSVGV
ncbi:unnamed protein product [Tuber aestivum]|uniref:RRM domain-containing protein n=1 Tax=Tuber aestivum TaxID=59557 RepID=A0A292PL66_9PEZI|nr:unnamed protein product [Tuber aestivum]